MVVTPSPYDEIEFTDYALLRSILHFPQFSSDFLGVPFDGHLAWAYQGLKSQGSFACVFPGVGFPHSMLTHGEPQEVKPHVSLTPIQRVGCPCFLLAQL